MYDFLTGPALWATFIIFVGGLVIRIVYLVGLSRGKDPVIYNHISLKWGFRSIFHWIIPFASASMRNQPFFVFGAFIFHIVLILVPIFFSAHIFLWEEAFGISLLSFPDILSDIMTLALIGSGLFLLLRRIIRTEVRILTGV